MYRRNTTCRKCRRAGLTLVELLLALAISCALLAAVATAMHGSLMSYRENEKIAELTQTSRSILNRLARDVRTADGVTTTSTSVTIIPSDDGVDEIEYAFANGQLTYSITEDGNTTTTTIVEDANSATHREAQISSFSVVREDGEDPSDPNGDPCTKAVTVRMELTIDGLSHTMTATASPRRNQLY